MQCAMCSNNHKNNYKTKWIVQVKVINCILLHALHNVVVVFLVLLFKLYCISLLLLFNYSVLVLLMRFYRKNNLKSCKKLVLNYSIDKSEYCCIILNQKI